MTEPPVSVGNPSIPDKEVPAKQHVYTFSWETNMRLGICKLGWSGCSGCCRNQVKKMPEKRQCGNFRERFARQLALSSYLGVVLGFEREY